MEEIINTYGKALLDLLLIGVLAAFLFSTVTDGKGNQGVLHIIGANLQTGETDYNKYTDFTVYAKESARAVPAIIYDASATMKVGINVITDSIKAVNYAGIEIPVKVLSIRNPYDVELADTYNSDTAEIELSQPGIYIMELSAVDDVNKKTICRIRIPVNQ